MPFALHLPCLLMEFKAHIHQKYLKYSSQCLNSFEDLGLCPLMQCSIFYLQFPWKDSQLFSPFETVLYNSLHLPLHSEEGIYHTEEGFYHTKEGFYHTVLPARDRSESP